MRPCFVAVALVGALCLHAPCPAQTTPPAPPATAPSPPAPPALDLPDLVKKISPSVVTVLVYDADGKALGQGSGFFIGSGRFITNRHVIENAHRAEARLASGRTVPVTGLLADDELADLAMLAVDVPEADGPALALSPDTPSAGERIAVIGSPLGLEQSVSDGIISSVRELPGLPGILQITAAVSPGSSGSPVLDLRGRVIGVVVSRLVEGQSLNFAIPAERVRSLTPAPGKPRPLRSATEVPGAEPIATEYWLGIGAVVAEDYEKALAHFQRAVEADPGSAMAHYGVGGCLAELKRFAEAIEACKQAIRVKPDSAEAHYVLGLAYGKAGRTQEAIEAYKQAIRLKPDLAPAHYNLGVAYGNLGRTQEEIESYKQAIRIKPDYADAHFNLGNAYLTLGRTQEAIESYKQAVRLKPNFAIAHYNLGFAYLIRGDRGAALEQYKVLKDLDKDLANELFNLIYP